MPLEAGIKGRAEVLVVHENTAAAVGSGLVPVFSTPSMIALMENAAVNAMTPHLAEGEGSVGTFVNITHDAASPIGLTVWAEAELTEVSGKALTFTVTAYDDHGPVGKGTHGRCIINVAKFLAKADAKKPEAQK